MEVQKREIEEAGWSLEEILPGHHFTEEEQEKLQNWYGEIRSMAAEQRPFQYVHLNRVLEFMGESSGKRSNYRRILAVYLGDFCLETGIVTKSESVNVLLYDLQRTKIVLRMYEQLREMGLKQAEITGFFEAAKRTAALASKKVESVVSDNSAEVLRDVAAGVAVPETAPNLSVYVEKELAPILAELKKGYDTTVVSMNEVLQQQSAMIQQQSSLMKQILSKNNNQTIPQHFIDEKKQLEEQCESLMSQIEKLKTEKAELSELAEKREQEAWQLRAELVTAQRNRSELERELAEAQEEITALETKLEENTNRKGFSAFLRK